MLIFEGAYERGMSLHLSRVRDKSPISQVQNLRLLP